MRMGLGDMLGWACYLLVLLRMRLVARKQSLGI